MADGMDEKTKDFVEALRRRLATAPREDSRGRAVQDFSSGEWAALARALAGMASRPQGGAWRSVIGLEAGDRKHVLVFLGLLPLIAEDAVRSGRRVLFLAPDSSAEARAQLEFRALMVLGTAVEFRTWDDLAPKPENNFRAVNLAPFWVIGDLDWSGNPVGDYIGEAKRKGLERVLNDGACPALLLHEDGRTPMVPFPPRLSSTPASRLCFIATAACGSPLAGEVEQLRRFRDSKLCRTAIGRAAVAVYERFSPPLAHWIESRPLIRKSIRVALIRPLACLVSRWH